MLRTGVLLVLLFCAVPTANAQIARGTVRDAETGNALQGVFVMLVDSAGQMRGGVLTDARGLYAMRAPMAGTFTLRADRIGHASMTSGQVVLTPGEASTVDINVRVAAIALAPVEVATKNRCIARPRSGQRTAQLWEEARKALTVARWVENQRQIQFSARAYVRQLDAHTMQVTNEGVRHDVSRKLPYAAIPADTLAKYGFVRNEGAGFVFYGPDAEVLLSRTFLDGHCFHSVEGSGATRGMVGLGFRPTAESKLADIEGVLWLDRNSLELRHIEYRYTNLGREYRVRDSGGRTEFVRLKSGAWIVSKWHIRMPTVIASGMERGEYRVVSMQEEGGEVLSVREEGTTAHARTHDGIIRGLVYDSIRGTPLSGALVYLSGTSYQATTDSAGRFEMRGLPVGKYTITFSHAVLDSMPKLPAAQLVEVRQLEETVIRLGSRSTVTQLMEVCPAYRNALPPDAAAGVMFGYVRNERSSPVPNAVVSAQFNTYSGAAARRLGLPRDHATRALVRTDASGYYVICGVPVDHPIAVRVSTPDAGAETVELRITGRPYRRLDLIIKD